MSGSLKTSESQSTKTSSKSKEVKEQFEEKSPRYREQEKLTVVEVHANNVITDSSDGSTQSRSSDSSGKQVEKIPDFGLDYPDQGQGQGPVKKQDHMSKLVEFKDESGHVESRAIEMTRSFSSSQMSNSKVVADEDFFD